MIKFQNSKESRVGYVHTHRRTYCNISMRVYICYSMCVCVCDCVCIEGHFGAGKLRELLDKMHLV